MQLNRKFSSSVRDPALCKSGVAKIFRGFSGGGGGQVSGRIREWDEISVIVRRRLRRRKRKKMYTIIFEGSQKGYGMNATKKHSLMRFLVEVCVLKVEFDIQTCDVQWLYNCAVACDELTSFGFVNVKISPSYRYMMLYICASEYCLLECDPTHCWAPSLNNNQSLKLWLLMIAFGGTVARRCSGPWRRRYIHTYTSIRQAAPPARAGHTAATSLIASCQAHCRVAITNDAAN